ncbi:MAG: peptigoglycan-binding protein LysM, partial [Proteobacteria bacterium]|nr:peptigoglycan-binding protein LysM [Pseudomonadota bacterium]
MQQDDKAGRGGIGGLTLGLGAAAGIGVGLLVWFLALHGPGAGPGDAPEAASSQAASTVTGTAASVASAPAATPEPAPESAPEPAPEPAPAAQPVPPAIDTVRAEADGTVLVAGSAPAGAGVSILVDGTEAGKATPDASGKFAAFLTLGPSANPRVLSLIASLPDGGTAKAAQEVILNPTPPAPAAVATAAAPVTAPETAQAAPAPAEAAAPQPAATAPAAAPLVADESGVTKLTAEAPVAEVVIDTIGYDRIGNVDIAGRGAAGQFVRLYVDNELQATAPLAADGKWRVKLTSVEGGVHQMRADQVDGAGKVTSRVETPFQREEPAKVA